MIARDGISSMKSSLIFDTLTSGTTTGVRKDGCSQERKEKQHTTTGHRERDAPHSMEPEIVQTRTQPHLNGKGGGCGRPKIKQ